MPSPFPCSPVIGQWLWKKTQIQKKKKKLTLLFLVVIVFAISQERREGWSWFLDRDRNFLLVDTINFVMHFANVAKSLQYLKNGEVFWLSFIKGIISFICQSKTILIWKMRLEPLSPVIFFPVIFLLTT